MGKKILIICIGFLFLITLISSVSAEFWSCFSKGEKIDFCNPKTPDRTCSSNMGCSYCMNDYNETKGCYNQGNWMVCMGIKQECSGIGGGSNLDAEPPNMSINTPEQDEIYTSKSILLDIELDERASIYYYDNIYGKGRWTRICSKCWDYNRKKRFKEGINDLTFWAVDVVGNDVYKNLSFFIDTKDPRIYRTEPRGGYANGMFEVQYTELNLENITLTYGNSANGFFTAVVDGANTEPLNCNSGTKQWCEIDLDLTDYNNQKIEYYFTIEDIAGNKKESKPKSLDVDTMFPVLNNPDDFWEQGIGRYNKYVYFNFNVAEKNFDEITYSYTDSRGRLRERRLCSRLNNGICKKRMGFRKGNHELDVKIMDEAGNAISTEKVIFEVI